MSVLDRLARAVGSRSEIPNKELAGEIVRSGDTEGVRELVANLANRDRGIQGDCIKVLYEVGALDPALIAPHHRQIGALLASRNNRLVWGAMTALDCIAPIEPKAIHALLPAIVAAARNGSVITRDHAVSIIARLATIKRYAAECAPLLIEQLATAPDNQFPAYAETALPAVDDANRGAFIAVIAERFDRVVGEAKRRRVARVLKRMAR